jgi:hypothetical protein
VSVNLVKGRSLMLQAEQKARAALMPGERADRPTFGVWAKHSRGRRAASGRDGSGPASRSGAAMMRAAVSAALTPGTAPMFRLKYGTKCGGRQSKPHAPEVFVGIAGALDRQRCPTDVRSSQVLVGQANG